MLMPPEVAPLHKAYVERFRQTQHSNVMNRTRTVMAVTKSQRRVLLELNLRSNANTSRDAPSVNGKTTEFVAWMRPTQDQLMLEAGASVNDSLIGISPIPIVAISTKGIILRFNAAAETFFEFTAAQVVGKSISIIMPEEIQRSHEMWLQRYAETGVKHVIDHTREVRAETKSGRIVVVDLTVREVRTYGRGDVHWSTTPQVGAKQQPASV